jgi:hypothetical protein
MRSALQSSALTLALVFFLAAAALSQCNNPSSPGVVIYTPTDGSTVVYDNEVSARFTPASGATITGFILYDNGVVIDQCGPGDAGLNLYDGGMYDGSHDVVVKAKDSAGNVYQASSKFFVTGQGYAPCPPPSSPGINICNPPEGSVYRLHDCGSGSHRGVCDNEYELLPGRETSDQSIERLVCGFSGSAGETKHAIPIDSEGYR